MSFASSAHATLIASVQDGKTTVKQWEAAPEMDGLLADPPLGLWAHLDGTVQSSPGMFYLDPLAPPN